MTELNQQNIDSQNSGMTDQAKTAQEKADQAKPGQAKGWGMGSVGSTGGWGERWKKTALENVPTFAALAVILLFVVIIGSLFWPYLSGRAGTTTLLRELSNFEVARGLITFLVAVTTVGIAIILTAFIVATNDKSEDNEKKFTLGKEVLTLLIGVLGTIVGFYFGATNSPSKSSDKSPMETVIPPPAGTPAKPPTEAVVPPPAGTAP